MKRINFYEAMTGIGHTRILAVKGWEDNVVNSFEELDEYRTQGYSFFADRNLVEEIEEVDPKDRLLSNADVVKAIKEHMEFLYEEYGIISKNGVVFSSGDITPVKIFASFAQNFECALHFDGDKPVIIFEKTGHRVPIKELESIYPSRIEVSPREAQWLLNAMYKNTFSSLTEIAEFMNMDEEKVKQVYYDMKKAMRELI